jgi:hypothetical protein
MATFIDEEAFLHTVLSDVVRQVTWHTARNNQRRYTIMYDLTVGERAITAFREYTAAQPGITHVERGPTDYEITVTCAGLDDDRKVLMWLQDHLQPQRPMTGTARLHVGRDGVRAHIKLLGHFTDVGQEELLKTLIAREGIASALHLDRGEIQVVFSAAAAAPEDLLRLGEVLDQRHAGLTMIVDDKTLLGQS